MRAAFKAVGGAGGARQGGRLGMKCPGFWKVACVPGGTVGGGVAGDLFGGLMHDLFFDGEVTDPYAVDPVGSP